MYRIGGRRINFPKDIPYENTYQYVGVKKFVNNIEAWGLNDGDTRLLLDILVYYAKDHNILNKGAAILTMGNIIDICRDKLEEELKYSDSFINRMQESYEFVQKNGDLLLIREKPNGLTNITSWFRTNKFPLEFVTVSKTCLEALNRLDKEERDFFPSSIELLSIRIKILSDPDRCQRLRQILGPDLQLTGIS